MPLSSWFRPRTGVLLALVLLFQLSAKPTAAAQAPLTLEGLGRGTAAVDGVWQFHEGDDLGWAQPAYDDSQWQPIRAGKPWEGQGHRNLTGFGWYRRHIVLPRDADPAQSLALYIPSVDSSCEVYWNGHKVGSIGEVPPHPVWYFYEAMPSGSFGLGAANSGVLAIRLWKAPHVFLGGPDEGGLISVPQIGTREGVQALVTSEQLVWLRSHQFTFTVAHFSALIGVLVLLVWLRNRERTLLLWLAIAMFFPQEMLWIGDMPGLISFRFSYGLIGVVVGFNDLALWMLQIALLNLSEHKQLVRWTRNLAIVEISLDLVDTSLQFVPSTWQHPRFLLFTDIASTIPAVIIEFWGVAIILLALRHRLDAARWMLAISALVADLLQAFDDTFSLGTRWTHWTFAARIDGPLLHLGGSALNARTISSTFMLLSILYVAWRYSAEQRNRQYALEQEYKSAQELQQVLIPESLPALARCKVSSAYRPAQEVGGDFFQVVQLKDDATLLVIGDVSGKGLHAAMTVALIVGAIRSTLEITEDPAQILNSINRRLHGRLRNGFATCLVALIDENTCTLANAGHLPPYLNAKELQLAPALPLGILPEAQFETDSIALQPGDTLTLYTDGLLEARNSAGDLFGFERIAALLQSEMNADGIADAAQRFGQEDDITVLTVTVLAAPVDSAGRESLPLRVAEVPSV